MSLIVEIKVTDSNSRFRHGVATIAKLVIKNMIGHPEAPYRGNYQAKYLTPAGNLVETVEIKDFDRTNGAFALIKRVLDTSYPTRERFTEVDLMYKLSEMEL